MTEMVAHRSEGLLLVAQSNAGLPVIRGDDVPLRHLTRRDGRLRPARMRGLGVELVGGCCGSTPAHMAAMAAALNG